jgi:hypothetical protein
VKDPFFLIDRKHPAAWLSVALMLAAALVRGVYFWGKTLTPVYLWIHCVTVLVSCLFFVFAVLVFGEKRPELTAVSVLLGVFFFMVKAFTFETVLHTVLCLILYTAVLVLYSLTVFGVIRTKYLLYPLFGLPFLYHVIVEDSQLYYLADPMPPFTEWLPEISVLCIMASLFFIAVAMKKNPRLTKETV